MLLPLALRNVLVINAKIINKHIIMKKFSKPGNVTKNPAPIPLTVVIVVSKIVCPVSSIELAIPTGVSPLFLDTMARNSIINPNTEDNSSNHGSEDIYIDIRTIHQ